MIDLNKRQQDATVSLVKQLEKAAAAGHDLGEITAQVILVFDYSASMAPYYSRGEVQELTERTLGLALPLDDDGDIQVFPFDHRAYDPFAVDVSNYAGVIDDWRYRTGRFGRKLLGRKSERDMGGTDYSAVIDAVLRFTADEGMLRPGKPPVLVLFQTDGSTNSPRVVEERLARSADLPIFWQFLGLGPSTQFLDVLDNLPGRRVDNVGKYSVASIVNTSSADFYDGVTSEFVTQWIPAARAVGVLKDR